MLQFTDAEAGMITAWSKGAPIERTEARERKKPPLGRGKFMLKPSKDGTAGIPIQVLLTATEQQTNIHDTNVRFRELLDGAPSEQAMTA